MTNPKLAKLSATESNDQVKVPISLKTPILLGVLAVLVFWFFGLSLPEYDVTLRWSGDRDAIQIADSSVNAKLFGTVSGLLMLVIAGLATWFAIQRKKTPVALPLISGALFLISVILVTASNGSSVDVNYLLGYTLTGSVAIVLGSMAGLVGERVGVVNIAIEGQLLAGAFVAALVANITGNLYIGLIAAAVGAGLVSLILAVFAIKYVVEQIIIGVVINLLVSGLTGFLYATLRRTTDLMGNPGTFPSIKIPILGDIPVLGNVLFNNNLTTYLMFVLVFLVWFVLFKTKLGLRIRAIGEHPLAADTVGLNVNRTRFWTVTIAGMIAGIGGAALSIGSVGAFGNNMSAGQGFIALAVVILGRWHPLYAAAAALLFGFSQIFRIWAVQAGSPIPPDLIQATPYVVTLLAVTLLIGKSVAPAAVGKAYEK